MPIETNPVAIRPVGRPQTASTTDGVARKEDGSSSGFSPKTNVSIKNAVNDMTGILSKISANQQEGMEKLPENLQKVIQNVMRHAFSMEETLSQGIGSTLESQRFSMEQLAVFSRMLSQMAVLSDKGFSMEISDQMQALLTNLKNYLAEQEGSTFEPIILNKLSFELLDTKSAEELPEALQQLLAQLQMAGTASMPQSSQSESSSFQFLKQLVQFFMPRPAEEEGAQPYTQQQPQQENAPETAQQRQNAPQQQGTQQSQQNAPQQQGTQQSQQNAPQQQGTQQFQQNAPQQQGQSFSGNANVPLQNADSGMVRQGMPQGGSQQTQWQEQSGPQNQQQPQTQSAALQEAREQLLQQPLQNTAQTMQTMKSLAQLLLKSATLTQQDAAMLQNFVNGKETVMNENDARHLQNLLRLCQQNVPATVQQAAIQQNMPDLPRLWAFMQLCDMAFAKNMKGRELKKAGRDVADFVTSMRHSMGGENYSVRGQRSLNFMIPLFLGDNEVSYPSYIHVYDENARDPETNMDRKETWLRLCVLTDNIGAVELICRVYEDTHLDMRVFFSNTETANEFRAYVPELKDTLKRSSLQLEDFKVGAVGERRFL